MYPMIHTDLQKLRGNARFLAGACHRHGMHLCAVTKGVCAQPAIVNALADIVDSFGDSRLPNLAGISHPLPKMLLRLGDPAQAEDIVRLCDVSLQSELRTIQALGRAAEKLDKTHSILLMVDLGDLREGLMYTNYSAILQTAAAVKAAHRLVLQGITHLRIGESLLLGTDTATGEPLEGLHHDVFTLQAVLGEVQEKPSRPIGESGPNAFGERVTFPDLGPMRRGIALIGRQDIDAGGLTPRDSAIRVLGASSDHLLLDLTRAPQYRVGDVVSFQVNYGAMLRAFTSPYVEKTYAAPQRVAKRGEGTA